MINDFQFDVFLSHSAKDKAVVRELAARLQQDGVRVWLDEEQIKPGDSIPAKIEAGLEHSRVLVLCMSAHAFGSEWAQLEAGTFRFRDPLNKERRFIPLRLDDAPIKGSLAQFLYINWHPAEREQEYAKLLEACHPVLKSVAATPDAAREQVAEKVSQLDYKKSVLAYAFSQDGKHALYGTQEGTMHRWDAESGRSVSFRDAQGGWVYRLQWSDDQRRAVSCGEKGALLLWDVALGSRLHAFEGHTSYVRGVAWCIGRSEVLSGSGDKTVRLWDADTGQCKRISNQSKERALVGEVISTVALADQISREFNVSDQGIDMEIEFTDDAHEATNRKLYLQLKSGDSYLRERKSDGAEIFIIKKERHARHWMASAFPVLLVIRNSEGEVRWMEVRDWLKRESDNGKKPVTQIVFTGERFDVMSVRRWRERILGAK